jgi:hypothetical protein
MKQFKRVKRKLSLSCMEVGRTAYNFYLDGRKLFWRKCQIQLLNLISMLKMGKYFSKRFFCTFGPCLEGFRIGWRPYLSVDSTTLNGRWSRHLPSTTRVDGHNWMYPIAYGFFESESKESWT